MKVIHFSDFIEVNFKSLQIDKLGPSRCINNEGFVTPLISLYFLKQKVIKDNIYIFT